MRSLLLLRAEESEHPLGNEVFSMLGISYSVCFAFLTNTLRMPMFENFAWTLGITCSKVTF